MTELHLNYILPFYVTHMQVHNECVDLNISFKHNPKKIGNYNTEIYQLLYGHGHKFY